MSIEQNPSAAKSLQVKDLKKPGEDQAFGKHMVEVEGVEEGAESPAVSKKHYHKEHSTDEDVRDHETDRIHTTYTVEEDTPPSFMQKLRGKFVGVEDRLKPKDAKATDPHPEVTFEPSGAKPGIISKIQQSIWGKREESNPDLKAPSDLYTRPQKETVRQDDAGRSLGSSELGTGYEESSEEGGFSESSTPASGPPKELFKPADNVADQELEDFHADTGKRSVDEDIRAPNMFERAKEEVDALSGKMHEKLDLKEKSHHSGELQSEQGHPGLFSRLAEKMGYGDGHNRTRSE